MIHSREQFRVNIGALGDLDTIFLEADQRRRPGWGEIEIAVDAAALNFKDVLISLGLVSADARHMGSECAGVVVALGDGVSTFSVGERVVVLGHGFLARYVTVAAEHAIRIADELDIFEAVTIPAAFITADYSLLTLGRLQKGERVLIHAASGGVGFAAVQIARRIGAEIHATAGSEVKRAFLREHGVHHVMDSRSLDFARQIRESTNGRGVDVVLNSLGGPFIDHNLSILAPRGRMVELGVRDIMSDKKIDMGLFRAGISLCVLSDRHDIPNTHERLLQLVRDVEQGAFLPLPYRIFPRDAAAHAFKHLAAAQHIGKVIIAFSDIDESRIQHVVIPQNTRRHGVLRQSIGRQTPSRASEPDRIHPSDGPALLERALSTGLSQVIISTTDLATRLVTPTVASASDKPTTITEKSLAVPESRIVPVPPDQNGIESTLVALWKSALGLSRMGIHDDFFDLGGDSLLAVQVLAKARRELGVELPPHSLVEAPTIAKLAARIGRGSAKSSQCSRETLVCLREGSGGPPLILLHPVGGQVYIYRDLAKLMPPEHPVYGVRALPRQSDDANQSISTLADAYFADILAMQSDGPYLLGGSSFGGILAYEIACRLHDQGRTVALLAMLDAPGPGHMPTMFEDDASILAYVLTRGSAPKEDILQLRALSRNQLFAHFLENVSGDRTPLRAESVTELEDLLVRWRANQRALLNYAPRPYQGKILYFSASETDGVNARHAERAWQKLASGIEIHTVPGTHMTMNDMPNVRVIAEILRAAITSALR